MSSSDVVAKWRYRLVPDHVIGELLTKDWIDTAIPVVMLVASAAVFALLLPNFVSVGGVVELLRQMGELTFVTLGMAVVIMAGGGGPRRGAGFSPASFSQRARASSL